MPGQLEMQSKCDDSEPATVVETRQGTIFNALLTGDASAAAAAVEESPRRGHGERSMGAG